MTATEPTDRELFVELANRLRDAGIADAVREVRYASEGIAGAAPVDLQGGLLPRQRSDLIDAVNRRANGVPLAYVVRRAAFRYLELHVDERVLIPRPETEGLVQHVLDWCGARSGLRATEVGVGSGCIICSLSTEGRFDFLVGVDISRSALEVARINVCATGSRNVSLLCGDAAATLGRHARFDVLVSNPPYLTRPEYDQLDPSVRDHEPRTALVAGHDGLDAIRRIATDARRLLRPGGLVALEIDARRAGESRDLVQRAGFASVRIHDDVFARPRYLLAQQPRGEA